MFVFWGEPDSSTGRDHISDEGNLTKEKKDFRIGKQYSEPYQYIALVCPCMARYRFIFWKSWSTALQLPPRQLSQIYSTPSVQWLSCISKRTLRILMHWRTELKRDLWFRKVMQLLLGNLWPLTDFPSLMLSPAPAKQSDSSYWNKRDKWILDLYSMLFLQCKLRVKEFGVKFLNPWY